MRNAVKHISKLLRRIDDVLKSQKGKETPLFDMCSEIKSLTYAITQYSFLKILLTMK